MADTDNVVPLVARAQQRGSSGATLSITEDGQVRKVGSRIIDLQAAWLIQNRRVGVTCVPAVYGQELGGYTMEHLLPYPGSSTYVDHVFKCLLDIWRAPSRRPQPWSISEFTDKMAKLCSHDEYDGLITAWAAVDWRSARRGLTHGDPTYDNTMTRKVTGSVVLIDPIPATTAVPDLRSVDTGKMLTSLLGFETIRYGDPIRFSAVDINALARRVGSANEWKATKFWAAVHFYRARPYMTEGRIQDALTERAASTLRSI